MQMKTALQKQARYSKRLTEFCTEWKIRFLRKGKLRTSSNSDFNKKWHWQKRYRFNHFTTFNRLSMSSTIAEGFNEHVLELVDSDLSSWEAGDRLVIASTDFDFNQAEEVEVISVDGNKVTVRGN